MIVIGAGTNHWYHSDQIYRGDAQPRPALRLPGRERGRLGALRRPGEGASDHRLVDARVRARLEPAAAPAGDDAVLVPLQRPVALPAHARRRVRVRRWARHARRPAPRRLLRARGPARLDALLPDVRPQPARPRRRGGGRGHPGPGLRRARARRRAGCASRPRTPTRPRTTRACSRSGGRTCSAPRARGTSTSSATCSACPMRRSGTARPAEEFRPSEVVWREEAPTGKLDLFTTIDFRMNGSALYSDIVLPAATWYEKHDLSSTDLHPFVHSFNPAVPPPWETRSDFDIFKRSPSRSAGSPRRTSACVSDVVAAPLLHDTPDELAQPLGKVLDWKRGECDPVPGQDDAEARRRRARLRRRARQVARARPARRGARDRREGDRLEAARRRSRSFGVATER